MSEPCGCKVVSGNSFKCPHGNLIAAYQITNGDARDAQLAEYETTVRVLREQMQEAVILAGQIERGTGLTSWIDQILARAFLAKLNATRPRDDNEYRFENGDLFHGK